LHVTAGGVSVADAGRSRPGRRGAGGGVRRAPSLAGATPAQGHNVEYSAARCCDVTRARNG
jgi:hypothetical protein